MLFITDTLHQIRTSFETELSKVSSAEQVEALKVSYLGRKGQVRQLFDTLSNLGPDEKKQYGGAINDLKNALQNALQEKLDQLQESQSTLENQSFFDYSLPGRSFPIGHQHPLSLIGQQLYDTFRSLNFTVVDGNEIEDDYHNFEALNIPKWHPARKMQDSFYITENMLLRTHTSTVQVRAMEKMTPPLRIVSINGRCYRRDASDATHYPVFHQIEGLYVDEGLSMADLSGLLVEMMYGVFGREVEIRFLPSYFPFVEPGAETLISCPFCRKKGCQVCQQSGWIELGGSGMVHPQVLRNVNIDPTKYSGFAFGWGVDRLAMLKYGIEDIRMLMDNHIHFLEQF
jgi:phenylalanyl-tRNA synthetase alpha chain